MKKYFLIILLALVCISVNAQTKPDTLTNEKVMSLLKAGLQPSLIITKIKTSITNFDVTTEGIIKLNSNSVPGDVINAMINPNSSNDDIQASNDSISIYKRWKEVSRLKNGTADEINAEIILQYNNDGTYNSLYTDLNTNQKFESGGKFEFSNDKKSIIYYHETGEPYTALIIKLTNKELETKGFSGGTEYHEFFIIDK